MGAVLAKFRKEKTTYEILENLEDEIKEIEEYSLSTQIQQKRYVGNFLLISIGLYIIGFLIFYFVFFPPTWMERITYSVPLLIFPMLIFFVKRLVAWFFQRKLNKNSSKLKLLRAKKKKLIEEVMDKETYKVAIEILNRFADKTNGLKAQGTTPRPGEQKVVTPVKTAPQPVSPQMATPMRRPVINTVNNQWQSPMRPPQTMMAPNQPMNTAGLQRLYAPSPEFAMGRRTPFPIINQQTKGVFEKMVDYLVGDGPYYRFAMICRQCYGHNGMAFLSEYEFSSFRCAFCGTLNPPKKVRPVAPPLNTSTPGKSVQTGKHSEVHPSSASASEKSAECESEVEGEGIVEEFREEPTEEQLLVEANADAPADVSKSEAGDEVDNSKIEQADRSITEEDVPLEILEKEEEEKKND